MKSFRIGQKVVCILQNEKWNDEDNGPRYNEIVTVSNRCMCKLGYYQFEEYLQGCFNGNYFEPLIEDEILEKELSKIEITIPI